MLTVATTARVQEHSQRDPLHQLRETHARAEQSYRPDIDGMRAIAVLAVVAYHTFPRVASGGFVGVDVFFVISGYLITQLILAGLRTGRFSIREFYRRRVRRILPALLVILVVFGAVGWYLLLPSEFARLGKSITWSALFLANALFARGGGYFDPDTEVSPMLHLWSLGVEEQFYLSWPVLMLLAFRRRQTGQVLSAVVASSLAVSLWGAWHGLAPYFFQPAARAWELGAGGMLAASRPAPGITAHRAATLAAVAGLVLIAVSVVLLEPDVTFPGARALLPAGGALLLIAAGPDAPLNRHLLASRPMVFVGQISYPLYLWHWPLLCFARIVLGRSAPPGLAVILVGIALVAAYATYRFVERPIRFGRAKGGAVPWLLTGLGAVAVFSASVQWHAIPARLSGPAFKAWEAAATDWSVPFATRPEGILTATVASRRATTALFVGDSHVQSLAARVARVIAANPDTARTGVFAIRYGCPPMPDLAGTQLGERCGESFEHVIELARSADVDTVVFVAFWESYLMNEFSPAQDKRGPAYDFRDRTHVSLGLDSPLTQRLLDSFQRTIASLVAGGHRVYIVLSNPTSPEFEPLSLLPASARLGLRPPERIEVDAPERSVDAGAYEAYVAPLMRKLRDIAHRTGAEVLDPRSTLCDGMSCPATLRDGGAPTHLDSNHLTSSYARERAGFIDPVLLGSRP